MFDLGLLLDSSDFVDDGPKVERDLALSSLAPLRRAAGRRPPKAVSPKADRLGVGFVYNRTAEHFVAEHVDAFDYLVVIPDLCYGCDPADSDQPRGDLDAWVRDIDRIASEVPIVAHHSGLSIGTVADFSIDYVRHMARWCSEYACPWHSEHLAFTRVPDANGQHRALGVALPLPYDEEVLELLVERVAIVRSASGIPFLLENSLNHFAWPDQAMSETAFLNALCERSGCGLLLDLSNLFANALHHGFAARDFVDELDLQHVVEIHVGGCDETGGIHATSLAGPCPAAIWDLLEYVATGAPNLRGVTLEYHESCIPRLGQARLRSELDRARAIFPSARPPCR